MRVLSVVWSSYKGLSSGRMERVPVITLTELKNIKDGLMKLVCRELYFCVRTLHGCIPFWRRRPGIKADGRRPIGDSRRAESASNGDFKKNLGVDHPNMLTNMRNFPSHGENRAETRKL